ncbi:hypothetical protein [Dietzia sp. WMMA184]|uniref:hypothetical protein n=1 Tax=Dietzia sp. WMMA184 TaxID=2039808 RepID=UPI000BDF5AD8|nr:hypothetical protein [Dietzia sp. WMMA184]
MSNIASLPTARALDHEPVLVESALTAQAEDEFWESRPELRTIRDFARARLSGPWSTFGYVLARAIAVIPPTVVLPPLAGPVASLNTFVAVVAPSGGGKGASDGVAFDLLRTTPRVHVAKPGSGEGIPKEYALKTREKRGDPLVQKTLRNSVLFNVSEIDTLAGLGRRSGSTLMSELRAAWSGEDLGFAYSDQEKKLRIERHRFRMCLVTGVQPGQASALLDEADGGTPQRFLWMPTTDPRRPSDRPDEPKPLRLPEWGGGGLVVTEPDGEDVERVDLGLIRVDRPVERIEFRELEVPQATRDAVELDAQRRLDGAEADELEGHGILVREKVAAGLMWLNGRCDRITDEDWELAGVVKAVSDRTRMQTQAVLEQNARAEARKRGVAEGLKQNVVRRVTEEDAVKSAADLVRKHLAKSGGTLRRKQLVSKIPSRRQYLDDAVERLEEAGVVTVETTNPGTANESYEVTLRDGPEGGEQG